MNKALIGTVAALAVFSASVAMACINGSDGIFPKNNAYIPAGHSLLDSVIREEFDKAIAKVEAIYAPRFTEEGRTLSILRLWEDGTVNAEADRLPGNISVIRMFGGLARHPKVTTDGFMLVLCHEMGHHLGGAPRKRAVGWATNEGGSDYFASLKCAREVWKDEDNQTKVANVDIPLAVTEKCQKAFDSASDLALCKRTAMAAKSVSDTLGVLNKTGDTDFEKPDQHVVNVTDDEHPAAQCRLDTYFAGAVCNKSKDVVLSATDPRVGACAQESGETLGIRPLCWYAPMNTEPKPDGGDTGSGSSWPTLGMKRRRH
jgi:hypothetical protein